jgi:hypothetical protein
MQISSNYSMNGVSYENRRRQNDIPLFNTERAKQENESINPYMADVDFDEKAFDMIGPNAPQEVKDAWMEAAKEVNANGMGIRKRVLCCFSGKIRKTQSENLIIGLLTENSYIHT